MFFSICFFWFSFTTNLFLTVDRGTRCCCSPSSSHFVVLCIQRSFSAYVGCNNWSFELLLPSYEAVWPSSSEFWDQWAIFLFFRLFCINPRDGCAGSAVSEIFRPNYLVAIPTPHLKSPFFPILLLSLNFSRSLDHVYMPKITECCCFNQPNRFLC